MVSRLTGIAESRLRKLKSTAFERGFDPQKDARIYERFVEDAPRLGRPREITPIQEKQIIDSVTLNRAGREKSAEVLAFEAGISTSSALRVLHKNEFSNVKPTMKPGLTDDARKQRLDFCLQHQDWTLEKWKNLVWSDETSVILGYCRGTVHIWRKRDKATHPTVICRRWKGVQEFMFWGCFTYNKKGPCHIYMAETAQEKKQAEKEIEQLNRQREPACRAEWEINTALSRMALRNLPGRKPTWRWSDKTGKLVRKGKGGVDWYRYRKVV